MGRCVISHGEVLDTKKGRLCDHFYNLPYLARYVGDFKTSPLLLRIIFVQLLPLPRMLKMHSSLPG